MEKTKDKKQFFDGIDHERSRGLFLPLDSKGNIKPSQNVKELILENIGVILDDIIDELDLENPSEK